MNKLERRRIFHNKIQQHKGKHGKYAPLEEIQEDLTKRLIHYNAIKKLRSN